MQHGIYVPLITPMLSTLAIDYDSLDQLTHAYIKQGIAGLVFGGDVSEISTLTDEEIAKILDYLTAVCSDKTSIIMDVSADSLNITKKLVGIAKDKNIKNILITVPAFISENQYELYVVIEQLANLYQGNIIVNINDSKILPQIEVLRKISKIKNVIGLADDLADTNKLNFYKRKLAKIDNIINNNDSKITLLHGESSISLISNLATIIPATIAKATRIATTNISAANNILDKYHKLNYTFTLDQYPAIIKYVLHSLKITQPYLRMPLKQLNAWQSTEIDKILLDLYKHNIGEELTYENQL
ncbi:MAG: dihydrodipicolinate synthase family protein [Legionellales bacterium]|jgi:4-hydroxy-tetrahydrodipicolinate synthase|nr:dihydrodipicolinate synthase family protein [Legionellales bacterium]